MTATASAPRIESAPHRKIVWLAVAEGRGHLMRAHLAKQLLGTAGIEVTIATTSQAGAEFIAMLGGRAELLSPLFRVVYDGRQNLGRVRTRLVALRYLASRAGCATDLARLERLAEGASLIVNDSFHPALLAAALAGTDLGRRVVHVHCENTRRAVEDEGGFGPLGRLVKRAIDRTPRLEIAVDDLPAQGAPGATVTRLPPLIAAPRPRDVVRAERGLSPNERLVVVYLNPYFRDPALARAIETAVRSRGFAMHAVAEHLADRPGWLAHDPRLSDAVIAADVFISAASAGAVAMARTFGVPLVVVTSDQPEQRRNVRAVAARTARVGRGFAGELDAALDAVTWSTPCDPALAIHNARALWLRTFTSLLKGLP